MDLSLPFGKKKGGDKAPPEATSRPPALSRITSLTSQGVSEPEIIKTLRSEGYSPMEVDAAMKHALRSAAYGSNSQQPRYEQPPVEQSPQFGQQPPQQFGQQPPQGRRQIFDEEPFQPQSGMDQGSEFPQEDTMPELPSLGGMGEPLPGTAPPMEQPPMGGRPARPAGRNSSENQGESRHELEEISEAIIEDKLDMFRKEVDSISDEIKRTEAKMETIEQRFDKLESGKRNEIQEVRTMINQYKESMSDVSARMASIERAMKDSLTPMMQTMRSLSEAIKELKKS